MADVKMGEASESVRVFAFSPLAIDACYSELWKYVVSMGPLSEDESLEFAPDKTMQRRVQTSSGLPSGILRAAAGSGKDRAALQEVVEGSGIDIPENLGMDDIVAVSNLKYTFRWPMEMRMPLRKEEPDTFQLKHASDCFLVRALASKGFDGLVVYVERASMYNVSVMFVGVPRTVPTGLLQAQSREDLRRELLATHETIVNNADANRTATPSAELGVATLCKFKNKDAMKLEEILRKKLPGGRKIDVAQHVCQLGMDEGGGFVRAATLMISRGLHFPTERVVDIDFRKFPNGYLSFVEITDTSSSADLAPACLAAAWINIPDSIRYE